MTKEFVSVVIPTYNRACVLEQSVRSVLNQTYAHLEVIVVDDGSTDDTKAVIEQIKDTRLRYIYQENRGACAARNNGVKNANGEYIAFHDSDDTWYPDKLKKQMSMMLKKKSDVIVCKLAMHHPDGTVTHYPKRIREGLVSSRNDLFGIGTQTIIARAEVLRKEPFSNAMPRYQDLEWIYRVIQSFSVYYMDEILVDYSIGGDSISKSAEKMYRALAVMKELHPEIQARCPVLSLHIIRDLISGWVEMLKKDPVKSGKYLNLMWKYWPDFVHYCCSRTG